MVDLDGVIEWIEGLVQNDTPDNKLADALAKGTHLYGRRHVDMQGTKLSDSIYAEDRRRGGKMGLLVRSRDESDVIISVQEFIDRRRVERLNQKPSFRNLIAYIKNGVPEHMLSAFSKL